jgi:hypothetical protein
MFGVLAHHTDTATRSGAPTPAYSLNMTKPRTQWMKGLYFTFCLLSPLIVFMLIGAFHRFFWRIDHVVALYTDDSMPTFIPMTA